MNVKEIRGRIVELSLHGAGPEVDLNTRALGWLNSAYFEILDELLPLLPMHLQQQETVTTDADGNAELALPVQRLLQVRMQGRELLLPDGPAAIYANGTTLVCGHEKNAALTVRYLPQVQQLTEDDAAERILLPVSQHSALVWGGLVWSALFERGFSSQSDLLLYRQQWEQAKQRVRFLLLGNAPEVLRARPFRLV